MSYPLTPDYYDMEKMKNMLQVPKMVGHAAKVGRTGKPKGTSAFSKPMAMPKKKRS